jgi:hypothetical protein
MLNLLQLLQQEHFLQLNKFVITQGQRVKKKPIGVVDLMTTTKRYTIEWVLVICLNKNENSIMHVKSKYIQAVEDAIDFIHHNVDGADHGQDEGETLKVLRELVNKMSESQHKRRVRYYVRKNEN